MRTWGFLLAISVGLTGAAPLRAQGVDDGRIRKAVDRALVPIQLGLESFNDSKPSIKQFPSCVSCHHEAIGLTTLAVAGRQGFEVDRDLERTEAHLILDLFEKMRPVAVRASQGDEDAKKQFDPFGDLNSMAGYLLGALVDHGRKPEQATEAATLVLLNNQKSDGRWTFRTPREPMQSSDFCTTAMAARVVNAYTPEGHRGSSDRAVGRGRAWLLANTPKTTDDKAFRVLGLRWTGADPGDVRRATDELRKDQRSDGGWSQVPCPEGTPDAYATGLALFALNQGGGVPVTDPAYRRGLAFLLDTQADDGTWHVVKRATAYQHYFDAGFPYEKDQFISLPATCWATMALSFAAEPAKPPIKD